MFIQTKTHQLHSDKSKPITRFCRYAERLLSLPRIVKQMVFVSIDLAMSIVCLLLALSLRYGHMGYHISPVVLITYAAITIMGLYLISFYRSVARIFFDAMMRNVLQLFVGLVVFSELIIYMDWLSVIPRSVPILYLFLFFIWLWSSRIGIKELLLRSNRDYKKPDIKSIHCDNVIIYGAGSAGKELYDSLNRSHKYNVVAFVDDDPQLVGAYLAGRQIYAASKLIFMINKLNAVQVFLALPSINRARQRQIIAEISSVAVKIKQLPSLHEIADGRVTINDMRAVDILDVLERQCVKADPDLISKNITGKRVLVTGAGGSIGSELCRQILKNQPVSLVLYELSEYALYTIHQELHAFITADSRYASIEVVAMIGNVTNEDRLLHAFHTYEIQTVYHTAAYKHVPLVEHNPFEGVINNVKGTYHCAHAAMQASVNTFVLISTDKAVRPTNIMGASKRLAELICQGMSKVNSQTCFSMVRFGNVLGSSGSVVPLFTKQIEQGGPITVTHLEVTRYFMTIPEAASLVIQAGAMAVGGEVFVLDMGKPVKIVDLAKRMIFLTGCQLKDHQNPNGEVEIVVTGLRPGEKLYEELIIGDDNVEATCHPLIRQAIEHSYPLIDIENMLDELVYRAPPNDIEWLKGEFKYFVEGYCENTEPS